MVVVVTAAPEAAVAGVSLPALIAAFRQVAPKGRKCRLDAGGRHVYDQTISWAQIAARPPQVPYAVPLASRKTGRYALLCFDLDVHQGGLGPDGVDEDTETLLELLTEAGARYIVAQSSPAGGRHVFVALNGDGAEAEDVAELARALEARLPTLDIGMLCNPRTGCVRPPGAPHRAGGRSQIDTYYHRDPHAALAAFAEGTDSGVVDRLLAALPSSMRQSAAGGRPVERAWSTDGQGRPLLAVERRELSPKVMAAATEELRVGEDASGRLWTITLGALFAGWTFEEYAQLCESAPGALHAREYFRDGATGRSARPNREVFLRRQWERAFDRAQAMPAAAVPAGEEGVPLDERSERIVRAVWGLWEQMQDDPYRWGGHAGPCDYKILRALLGRALRGLTLRVGASVRALAVETGVCATTASQALLRLAQASQLDGPAWITLDEEASGTRSAVWRLLAPEGPPTTNDQAIYLAGDITRTQGTPTPFGRRAKRALFAALEAQTTLSHNDCWTPHPGLGHGASHTYTVIRTRKDPGRRLTVLKLCSLTGFTWQTTLQHLSKLASVGLIVQGRLKNGTRTVRATSRSLNTVARELGVDGLTAARIERHRIEREIWAWWQAEQAWRTRPRVLNEQLQKHVKWGVPQTISEDPALRPDDWTDRADADIRWRLGRFPVRPNGRMDWPAARKTVLAA